MLDRVTLTGADDSVQPRALLELSKEFPFVEWGLLFSVSHQGEPRYPSEAWVKRLLDEIDKAHDTVGFLPKLSAHLCGQWVRELVLDGRMSFMDDSPAGCWPYFKRVQLNFHAHKHPPGKAFLEALLPHDRRQFIFQMDSVNDVLWKGTRSSFPKDRIVPLFDTSGGAGVLPNRWPQAYQDVYCGYAGGLGPGTIESELLKIEVAARAQRYWIDMETRIRSNNDATFDLSKVRKVLEFCKPVIVKEGEC